MERLTERVQGFGLATEKLWKKCKDDPLRAVEKLADRLADYEDSGLTPEEVMELANQKKAGLLEVRPCAVGDTVYVIRTRYKKSRYSDLEYDYAIHTRLNRLEIFPTTCYVGEKICTKTDLRFVGKTVFTTREAAMKVIEEAVKKLEEIRNV